MGGKSAREYLEAIWERYRDAGRKYKKLILDEFCRVCGHHRKHAIRLLRARQRPARRRKASGRPPRFGVVERHVLTRIWLFGNRPCSRRLKSMLASWLPFYERRYARLAPSVRENLLGLSKNTIDRLLLPTRRRYGTRGRSGTRPGTLLHNQIPIKTEHWTIAQPGFMQADTVAHCGSSLGGEFVWSLTFTDVFSGWTENRAVWNKGATGVREQLADIEEGLPFRLQGFHSDNGSEFLNHHLHRHYAERQLPIIQTRGRPRRGNDSAHVEQKNWTHVRQLLGYQRIDVPTLIPQINTLYRTWALFNNFFCTNLKLVAKKKIGSRYRKTYDEPKTPYQRLMDSGLLNEAEKTHLTELACNLNPFSLKNQIDHQQRQVLNTLR